MAKDATVTCHANLMEPAKLIGKEADAHFKNPLDGGEASLPEPLLGDDGLALAVHVAVAVAVGGGVGGGGGGAAEAGLLEHQVLQILLLLLFVAGIVGREELAVLDGAVAEVGSVFLAGERERARRPVLLRRRRRLHRHHLVTTVSQLVTGHVEQARSQEPCARGASSEIPDGAVAAGEVAAAVAAGRGRGRSGVESEMAAEASSPRSI